MIEMYFLGNHKRLIVYTHFQIYKKTLSINGHECYKKKRSFLILI